MLIAGIDPGLSGAVSLLTSDGTVIDIFDVPTHALSRNGKNKREVDIHALVGLLGANRIGHAFVEQVGAMPGQGVSAVFAFGKVYGILLGVLVSQGAPITFVSPQRWKKALNVPAAKDGARARASQLLPEASGWWQRVKDDGRAEATLIGLYGLRSLQAIGDPGVTVRDVMR